MRNISFSLTTPQIKARTKTVTRRLGWLMLKPGDRLQGCEKVMGRRNGQPLVKLAVIEVVSVRREPLKAMNDHAECVREGFPETSCTEFIEFFCRSHKGCTPDRVITRIEFRYV